jgi:hypothetical protein
MSLSTYCASWMTRLAPSMNRASSSIVRADAPRVHPRLEEVDRARDVGRAHREVNPVEQGAPARGVLLRLAPERVDQQARVLLPDRLEERQAHDVVPVQVREQHVERGLVALAHQRVAQLAQARAGVEDEDLPVGEPQLDAHGVASVAHRRQPRGRRRTADAVEADLHREGLSIGGARFVGQPS